MCFLVEMFIFIYTRWKSGQDKNLMTTFKNAFALQVILKLCDIITPTALSSPRKVVAWSEMLSHRWQRAAGYGNGDRGRHIKPEKFPVTKSSLIDLAEILNLQMRFHREKFCRATLFGCTRALLWSLEP